MIGSRLRRISTTRALPWWSLVLLTSAQPAVGLQNDIAADENAWFQVGGDEASFAFKMNGLWLQQGRSAPSALLTKAVYENFRASFEFKMNRWTESGFYIHAPWNGAFEAGFEIELADHHDGAPSRLSAGAVWGHVAPKEIAVKEHEKWNHCEVTLNWPQLVVKINDVVVQDLDCSAHAELGKKLRRGHLGFQNNHGWGMEVRRFFVESLPDSEGDRDMLEDGLGSWREVRKKSAQWVLKDGTLNNLGGYGYLQYPHDIEDFRLSMYYRTTGGANGGVFFRWLQDDSDRGNEIQLLDMPGVTSPSGSIYGIARADHRPLTPGAWTLLQIHVNGRRATTYLNGKLAARTDKLEKVRPGRITLQAHRDNSTIEYRDLSLVVMPRTNQGASK